MAASLLALLPFLIFITYREKLAPGYLNAMWQNDFGGRFANGKDGHEGPWYYYIEHLFTFRFNWFIWCLVPAIVWAFIKQQCFGINFDRASSTVSFVIRIKKYAGFQYGC